MSIEQKGHYKSELFQWLNVSLRNKKLKPTRPGKETKLNNHPLDLVTGYWKNRNSANDPPRWLYHIIPEPDGLKAEKPAQAGGEQRLGFFGAENPDKAAVFFRLLPLIKQGPGEFIHDDRHDDDDHDESFFEVSALFVFHGPTPRGSSTAKLIFDPATGVMKFQEKAIPYIGCWLLGLKPRDTELQITADGEQRIITYGEVIDALSAGITVAPIVAKEPIQMPAFDLTQENELNHLENAIEQAWEQAGPATPKAVASNGWGEKWGKDWGGAAAPEKEKDGNGETVPPASLEIPKNPKLLGIDQSVYRQINGALKSGKRHIMLYGPPGTGKTTLAQGIAETLASGGENWTLITGSSDWSSQDIIGGYQPIGNGGIAFIPGVLLRRFDQPLIIDELNRCDIDKVIGPLFTVLSGQQTTLPYRLKIENPDSLQYVILPESKPSTEEHEFAPGQRWRLIATINSIDKAALYQMSYALSRRFGWIYVDAPQDKVNFIVSYLQRADPTWNAPTGIVDCPLGTLWAKINEVRVIGPAPIIDAIKMVQTMEENADFFVAPSPTMRDALLDAVDAALLPLLDGIGAQEADDLAEAAIEAFSLSDDEASKERIKRRMESLVV